MEKRCPRCTLTKPVADFYPSKTSRDGLSFNCVACAREAEVISYSKLRAQVLAHLGGLCLTCGYSGDSRALTLDHVEGDGGAQRRAMGGRAILREALLDGAGRFQLLCMNCNIIKRAVASEWGARSYSRAMPEDVGTKWCPRCETDLPATEFYKNSARSDGLSSYCRDCMVAATLASYRALRLKAIDHLGGCCVRCSYATDHRALVFDHVNGDGAVERKGGTVHRARLNAVLADTDGRYQLLCANCNEVKHQEDGERGARVYVREIPTERVLRPDERSSDEARQRVSEQSATRWRNDPEYAALMRAAQSRSMKARWAAGEVPNRRRPPTE